MEISIKQIEKLLQETLNIQELEVIDETAQHADHHPMANNLHPITHVNVRISSLDLNGLSRVQQHKCIYNALKPVTDAGLHSIQLTVL